jgi:hypothetical protein
MRVVSVEGASREDPFWSVRQELFASETKPGRTLTSMFLTVANAEYAVAGFEGGSRPQ